MADSWNWPALINKIAQDVPFLQRALNALLKQDPTSIKNAPSGAKRLYEVSSGKWQWQEYNGSSWAAVPFLQHNVDQLDGYHAAITPAANTVAVRNASGLLQDSITGNAATASSAATLSQTLPVNKGGTGATTSEAARANLGVPPTSHASTATTYGVGNSTQYGHLKLSDATNSMSSVSGGVAATPVAVKAAKDTADAAQSSADAAQSSADAAQSSADAAMTKASTLATSSTPGIVKPGTGMTVDAAGAMNVSLNNTVTSSSTTQAATANAVKMAYNIGRDSVKNTRTILTTSGTYSAPVTGWYRLELRGGGGGGGAGRALYGTTAIGGGGGSSGAIVQAYMYLTAGIKYSYTIGAGGSGGKVGVSSGIGKSGGSTTFNGLTANGGSPGKEQIAGQIQDGYSGGSGGINSYPNGGCSVLGGVGGGVGHGRGGDGGGGVVQTGGGESSSAGKAGGQGCVILDYFDPEKEAV